MFQRLEIFSGPLGRSCLWDRYPHAKPFVAVAHAAEELGAPAHLTPSAVCALHASLGTDDSLLAFTAIHGEFRQHMDLDGW